MALGKFLKTIDAFPKLIDIEVNKTFSGAIRKLLMGHVINLSCDHKQ